MTRWNTYLARTTAYRRGFYAGAIWAEQKHCGGGVTPTADVMAAAEVRFPDIPSPLPTPPAVALASASVVKLPAVVTEVLAIDKALMQWMAKRAQLLEPVVRQLETQDVPYLLAPYPVELGGPVILFRDHPDALQLTVVPLRGRQPEDVIDQVVVPRGVRISFGSLE